MGQIKVKDVVIRDPKYSGNQESKVLTEFEEMDIIGKGAFGCAVLCKNHIDEKIYVVKKIAIGAYDHFGYEKVKREAVILSGLRHRNVVGYFSVWVEPTIAGLKNMPGELVSNDEFSDGSDQPYPGLYIQQEYCNSSLAKILDDGLEEYQCLNIFKQIMDGLEYIHANEIMHGDLSADNIFIHNGIVKLADFGLARYINDQDAEIKEDDRQGLYSAPDQIVDAKVDIYSAGLLLFAMLSRFKTVMERWAVLMELKKTGELPPSWSHHKHTALLLSMLDKDTSKRPSASEIAMMMTHGSPPA